VSVGLALIVIGVIVAVAVSPLLGLVLIAVGAVLLVAGR
jgi:hypothetical protein